MINIKQLIVVRRIALSAILSLLMLGTSFSMFAQTFSYEYEGQTLNYKVTGESTVEVAQNTDISGAVIIPEEVVCNDITYFVTSIGEYAFRGNSSLRHISIPSSVVTIEYDVFDRCKKLEVISVDSSNPNYSSYEGILFDKEKETLVCYPAGRKAKHYIIPNSVSLIKERAFLACQILTTIEIPNSVKEIEAYSFRECASLTSIKVPNSVTSIGRRAFSDCPMLSYVTISKAVNTIKGATLLNCPNLKLIKILSNQIILPTDSDLPNYNVVLAVPADKLNDYKQSYSFNRVIPLSEIGFEPESYELAVKPSVLNTLSLFIDAFENVNGFQMDVTLPEGLAIAETEGKLAVSFGEGAAAASHTITASKVTGSNKYRIVAYSSKNEPFLAGENLLNIAVVADESFKGGEINVSDVFIRTTDDEGYQG
ncbi:MAG: leucine-rich repeat domain-containing protein, partial [Muribaculaceae bacterium]|nr:leucine-rich repeat domain-containing protein [Muribaculaceae bacterium]